MVNIFQKYLEMAMPREKDFAKKYYHGTSKTSDYKDIMKNGIKPPDLSLVKKRKMTPREGKVYITPDLSYAQIYAIGGDMAGSSDWMPSEAKEHGYGYLFVIGGKDLKDIEPDEDGVGGYMSELLTRKGDLSIKERNFLHNYLHYLTPKQIERLKDGDYAEFAHVGKKLVSKMDTEDIFWVLDQHDVHIAHGGIIKPKESWRIDLHRIKDLKRDGSNFFKTAERIK